MRRNVRADLDQLDVKILELYQRDTQLPAHRIGKAVGLSAAAVQRRLKQLRDDGVIAREAAQLDPGAVGLGVTCIVNVTLASDAPPALTRFQKQVRDTPQVQQCYYVTGSSDFVLIVLVADMEAYEALTHGALFTDANVHKFTTQVVLSRTKVGLDVCLDAARAADSK
jgi:Lrp/AsnC family leucine-responsive transcriptional regulator